MSSQTVMVDRYRLIATLGKSERAETYLSQDSQNKTLIVIKKAVSSTESNLDWEESFSQRAGFWSGLKHPNLVQVHAVWQHAGHTYCSMEFLTGESLHALRNLVIHQRLRLIPAVIAQIFHMLSTGLAFFHQSCADAPGETTLVHGGIDLHNTFLDYDGTAKLMEHTSTKDHNNSPAMDQRTDIYDLGLTIFELITGRFDRTNPSGASTNPGPEVDAISKILDTNPIRLPAKLRSILMTCLATSPGQRFQNSHALQHALSSYAVEIEDQDPRSLLSRFTSQGLLGRKQLKNALVHAAMHIPHLDDCLFENLGDVPAARNNAIPDRQILVNPSPAIRIKSRARSSSRWYVAFGLAMLLGLVSVILAVWYPWRSARLETVTLRPARFDQAHTTPAPRSSPVLKPIPSLPVQTKTPRERKQTTKPVDQHEKATAMVQPAPAGSEEEPTGFLRLNTKPQTSVFLGGKFMGNTPIEDMALKPGWYRFELINKEAGISKMFRVEIRKGQVSSHTIFY